MQMVKGEGAVWAGSKITMTAAIDLSTQRVFKVKVLSPVAGKRLLLKFEGAAFTFQKLSSPITTANVWEELTFDFSIDAINNLNNQIVFIFDLGTQGDGSLNSTYYFDDIAFSEVLPVSSFELSNIKIYPNPVNNQLEIESKEVVQKVTVYNILGQEVLIIKPNSNSTTLQTSELYNGVYTIITFIEGKETTSRFIKE